jgi:hypothetical protein
MLSSLEASIGPLIYLVSQAILSLDQILPTPPTPTTTKEKTPPHGTKASDIWPRIIPSSLRNSDSTVMILITWLPFYLIASLWEFIGQHGRGMLADVLSPPSSAIGPAPLLALLVLRSKKPSAVLLFQPLLLPQLDRIHTRAPIR